VSNVWARRLRTDNITLFRRERKRVEMRVLRRNKSYKLRCKSVSVSVTAERSAWMERHLKWASRNEARHVCLCSPEINVILVYLGELKGCWLKYTENQANGVIISSRSYKIPFKPVVYYEHVATNPSQFLTVLFSKHCFRQTWSGCVQCVCVTHVDLNWEVLF